jgi:molecular chaperone DnaK
VFSTASDNQPAVSIHVLQGERPMAGDNKTLGRFELTGIPPAPRGVPQIEVTFDIDANGIVHVTAKDLGTGRAQDIRITASSGLSEEEIKRMVAEADRFATEDKAKKERAELLNQAETLIYSTERTLRDVKDKISASDKQNVESALAKLKEAMESKDETRIRGAIEEVTRASHALAQALYAQSSASAGADGGGTGAKGGGQAAGGASAKDDNVVDAEFEEVRENK